MVSRKDSKGGAEVLFRIGEAAYERVRELGQGVHGTRLLLARRLSPGGVEHRLLQALPLPEGPVLPPEEERARRRLEESVRLAGYLQHPAIARVYGLHEVGGTLFVDMEYVPGFCLDDLLALSLARGRYFPEPFLVQVGLQVAQALAHAHARRDERGVPLGILHRDINPFRIRVGEAGEVKLTDFGLARSRLPGRVESSRPRLHGALHFAAPEVLFLGPVDARADLFSLGAVLLELGTGRNLYNRPDVVESALARQLTKQARALMRKGLEAAAQRPGEYADVALQAATFQPEDVERLAGPLSAPMRALFRRLLRREPDERFETADALVEELLALREELGPCSASDVAEAVRRTLSSAARNFVEDALDEDLQATLRLEEISTAP